MSDEHADGSMTRSEEHLRVETETVPVRRVRLRKCLVTEDQTFTVAVTREEIEFDHVDVPEHARVPDGNGPLSDDCVEVVRYEERVVVTKEIVAVERVRLVRRVVTVDQTVEGPVRREIVDVDRAGAREHTAAPDGR